MLNYKLMDCWATPTNDSNDATKFYLSDDGCPTEDWIELKNSSCISFPLFGFANAANNNLYVHCAIFICTEDSGECEPSTCSINAVIKASTEKSTDKVFEAQTEKPEKATEPLIKTVPVTTTQTTTETIIESMTETTTEADPRTAAATTKELSTEFTLAALSKTKPIKASDTTARTLTDTVTPYRSVTSAKQKSVTTVLNSINNTTSQNLLIDNSTSSSNLPLLHLKGSIQIYQNYDEELESKTSTKYFNFKNAIQVEIKSILESSSLIENAKVSVTNINTANSNRRRNYAQAAVDFVSICSVRVSAGISSEMMSEIVLTLKTDLTIVDTNSLTFFDQKSFATLKITVEEPRIIKVESLSKTEISEKIGLIMFFSHSSKVASQ